MYEFFHVTIIITIIIIIATLTVCAATVATTRGAA
jgi:hypothetical protein